MSSEFNEKSYLSKMVTYQNMGGGPFSQATGHRVVGGPEVKVRQRP